MRNYQIPKTSKKFIAFIGLVIFLILSISAWQYYEYDSNSVRTQKYNELKSISAIKVGQISGWYNDEILDAKQIAKSQFLDLIINDYFINPSKKNKTALVELIKEISIEHNYSDICLADIKGNVILSLDSSTTHLSETAKDMVVRSAESERVVATDLYRCSYNKSIRLDMIAPIFSRQGKIMAVLLLRLDPNDYLFPLIQSWPSDSKTSETLLIRQEEDSVVFLNNLRHVNKAPLTLKISLTNTNVPAVKAVMGYSGIWEGPDYRGVTVLSDVKQVPGTNWYMIAKVDTSEIFADLHFRQLVIVLFALLLVLLSGLGLTLYYQANRRYVYQKLFLQEKALSEKEEEFRTTLYSIGDGVITTDAVGRIKQMNIVAEELTGWKEDEAKDVQLEDVFKIINENTRESVESPVKKVIKQGIIVGLANHTILISKSGTEIPIADSGAPIKNSIGEIIGVVLIFRDQTAERNANRIIRENEEIFKQLLKHSPIGIFFKDDKFRYMKVSSFFEEIFNCPANEIIGNTVEAFVPAETADMIHNEETKLLSDSKVLHQEIDFMQRNLSTIKFNIRNENGQQFIAGFVQDITNRKITEDKLRKLNRAIEQNPASIIITDKVGHIQYVNPKFTETTGYEFDEIETKLARILRPGILPQEEFYSLWEKISEGKVWHGEFRNKRKNGDFYWESVTIAPLLDEHYSISNYIIMNEDITTLKSLIDELTEAKNRAVKADKLKSEFLAQMSHEIRTPINTIMSFISLIRDELNSSNEESLRESFKMIELGSLRITRTIDSILNMSELQAGSYETHFEKTEICSDIIEPLYEEFRQYAQNKSLELELDLRENPITASCDVYTTTQLFANIIDNSIKYTKNGTISIESDRNIEGRKYISIKDTGIGMSEEFMQKIFEPFSQEEQGYTRKFEGTGLGLSLVHKYAEINNYEILVQSKKNEGTTFTILFPEK